MGITLESISGYIKTHERLALFVFASIALWFAIGKIDTLLANHDHANLQQAQVVAQVQQEKNEAIAKQMAQHDAEIEALNAKLEARDAQLTQIQAQLVTALTKQQAVDKTMTPTELIQRWNTLVPEAGAAVTPNGVTLPSEGARATVIELEKAPILQQQLDAKDEQLSNAQTLLKAEGQQVSDRDVLIVGLQAKSVDDAKVCETRIAVVKADARRSKRKWFIVGFVAGWVSRQVVKTYTGL
jgi:hypothetical protein